MKKVVKHPLNTVILRILRTVVAMSERMNDFATKNDLEKVRQEALESKEEVLREMRAIGKAVDKDAVTIIDHDRRIVRIEKHLSIR